MLEPENKIKEAKRAYYKEYRERNREKINAKHKEWRNTEEGKEKMRQAKQRYWEKKVLQELEEASKDSDRKMNMISEIHELMSKEIIHTHRGREIKIGGYDSRLRFQFLDSFLINKRSGKPKKNVLFVIDSILDYGVVPADYDIIKYKNVVAFIRRYERVVFIYDIRDAEYFFQGLERFKILDLEKEGLEHDNK